jgi:hypothetical protein
VKPASAHKTLPFQGATSCRLEMAMFYELDKQSFLMKGLAIHVLGNGSFLGHFAVIRAGRFGPHGLTVLTDSGQPPMLIGVIPIECKAFLL